MAALLRGKPDWAIRHTPMWTEPANSHLFAERHRRGQRAPLELFEAANDWADQLRFPFWLRESVGHALDTIPASLGEAWASSTDGADPNAALARLDLALKQIETGKRLDALAHTSIHATNRDVAAAASIMARQGRKHSHDARSWLEWLGIEPPKRHAAARIADELWWKRTIRSSLRRRRELSWLASNPAAIKWCSEDGNNERKTIDATTQAWAERREFVSESGERIAAPSPEKSDMRQQAEMLAIANGICTLAGSDSSYLLTITCPGRFHRTKRGRLGERVENRKWDGSTPADAFAYLQEQWTRFRAAIHRAGLGRHWVMGVQPHEDETPHMHVTFWIDEADAPQLEKIAKRYFRDNERERGDQHRVDLTRCGSAVNGVKYVARMITYISRAAEHSDDASPEQRAESLATKQWASTWGIRRFRSSHTRKTAWRLARRKDVLPDGDEMQIAARSNDYALFLQNYAVRGGKLVKVSAENRYGEKVRRVVGIELDGISYIKSTTWQSVRLGEAYSYSKQPSTRDARVFKTQDLRESHGEDPVSDETKHWRALGQALGDPNSFLFSDERSSEAPPPRPLRLNPCPEPPPAEPTILSAAARALGYDHPGQSKVPAMRTRTHETWVRNDGTRLIAVAGQWADASTGEIVGLDQLQPEPQHIPAPDPDAARAAWRRAVRDLGVWNEDGTPVAPSEARLSP